MKGTRCDHQACTTSSHKLAGAGVVLGRKLLGVISHMKGKIISHRFPSAESNSNNRMAFRKTGKAVVLVHDEVECEEVHKECTVI